MHEAGNEAISALLDGEADDLELRRLLKSLESDSESTEELLRQWQRYHLAQDVMHGRGVPVSDSLASRIAEQLSEEPAYTGQEGQSVATESVAWRHTLTRMAIAASVAAVFVVALQTNLTPEAPAATLAASGAESGTETQTSSEPVQTQTTLVAGSQEFTVDPAAEARLRLFLEGISVDVSEPIVTEQIQDSPLFRLVNRIQD